MLVCCPGGGDDCSSLPCGSLRPRVCSGLLGWWGGVFGPIPGLTGALWPPHLSKASVPLFEEWSLTVTPSPCCGMW